MILDKISDFIGWVEKSKNDTLKYGDMDFYSTLNVKQGSSEKETEFH